MNLSKLCSLTLPVVETIAEFLVVESVNFQQSSIEFKGAKNLVSYVDKKAEEMLFDKLGKIFPEAGFLAEEGTEKALENEWLWVIDPLDGTTNFMHKIPIFAVSVGLLRNNKAVMGVVAEVNQKEYFYAWEDGGAFCNGKRISVSQNTNLEHALLATGFPYLDSGKTDKHVATFSELLQKARGLRRLGSASTDMCYVAAGRFDGFFEYNLSAWDVAGGAIIIKQAGGFVSDFKGEENYIYGSELLAGGAIHPLLLQVIKKHFNNALA